MFYSDTLRGEIMLLLHTGTETGTFVIEFTFDEWSKILLEAQRSQRLITDIVTDILAWGVEHYKYTSRKDARS